MRPRTLSLLFALAAASAHAQLDFSATFTSAHPLVSVYAFASYTDLSPGFWKKLGSVGSVAAGVPTTLTATTDAHADGRFALIGVYDYYQPAENPQFPGQMDHLTGVTAAMGAVNAAFALEDPDGNGKGREFFEVFPGFGESTVESYLRNGAGNLPYILNSYDQAHAANRYVVGSGSQELIAFSGATDIGGVTIAANPVPEPAAFAALGLGVAALVRRRRLG